ncbi:MAG: hypothetical protein ACREQ2_12520 [Candidatus Binatia bacterium]
MPNEKIAGLPVHLAPLLEPTPSGVAKLVAAWDGLNTESQILILMGLDTAGLPAYLSEKVHIKALDSATAYVRYLAARRLHFSRDDTKEKKAVKHRIEEDPDPLVRYCLLESSYGLFGRDLADVDGFFALPHEARLAKVRLLHGSGEAMANLIGHAVDHQLKEGKVSAIELFEILSDYVNKAEFKKNYGPDNESYDGSAEYGRGKDIDALWGLVLKVPEGISHILIENLPPGAGLSSGIPDDVLSGMSDAQLATLFNREDIQLKELRKKVFFEAGGKRGEVKYAAIRYNFDLEYAEFGAILALPKSEAGKIIGDLRWARNLSLCLYEAIYDVLLNGDVGDPLDAEFAGEALDRRLEQLKSGQRETQLRDLNLYQLAKTAVPWKKGEEGYLPSGELEFLSKAVVEGDTWGTFIAYLNVRAKNSPDSRILEKYLTPIDGSGEDEAGQLEDDDESERTELLDRIEKLTETVSSLTEQTQDKQIELTDTLRESRRDVTRLQATQDRQTLLLYVSIGLLVWLLIKLW